MSDQRLTFDDIADLALELGSSLSPSEFQGLLVGQLATSKRFTKAQWLAEAINLLQVDSPQDSMASHEIELFYDQTLEQLENENLDFALLLPDENVEFNQIVASISDWCAGFLAGFAIAGQREMSTDVQEILEDFAAISQVVDEDEIDEASQQALFDIAEYVRVAALSLFLGGGAQRDISAMSSSNALH